HPLQIPVEALEIARVAHVQDVSRLVAVRIQVLRPIHVEARIVGRELARSDVLPLGSEYSVLEIPVRVIVERMPVPILDRPPPEREEAAEVLPPVEPGRVGGLTNVGPIPDRDEALQVEGHLLASDASLQLATGEVVAIGDEGLAQIERVLVDRRDRVLPGC